MRELDKKKVYDLSKLNTNELIQLLGWLQKYDCADWLDIDFEDFSCELDKYKLKYHIREDWDWDIEESNADAKELFYTLENVQVDCRELTKEQIKNMCDVFIKNGHDYYNDKSYALKIDDECVFIQHDEDGFLIDLDHEEKHTITYDKFIELFSKEEHHLIPIFDKAIEVAESIAHKETSNKLNYELDFNFITQLAERMNSNKGKYEPYNWQKLDNIEDLKQALYRHVMEVMKGNYEDDNRLFGHLEAIALNSMFINYQLNNKP